MRRKSQRLFLAVVAVASLTATALAEPDYYPSTAWPTESGQYSDCYENYQVNSIVLTSDEYLAQRQTDSYSDEYPPLQEFCDTQSPSCIDECSPPAEGRTWYADVNFMFLRTHFTDRTVVGKIAEKYEFSPRLVLGTANDSGRGGRLRFWSYDRTTQSLNAPGQSLGVDIEVTDLEGTHIIHSKHTDLVLSGGVRWIDVKLDIPSGRSRADMPAATFAVDVWTTLCIDPRFALEWATVGGARWSISGTDWEGSGGLIEPQRDDNLTIQELYGGIVCRRQGCGYDLYMRFLLEAQNWRSDVLGASTSADSIGFVGCGLSTAVAF
jgi:hypothetical protein